MRNYACSAAAALLAAPICANAQDVSNSTVTVPNGQAYGLASRAGDEVNVMSYMTEATRAQVRNRDRSADVTAAIQAALNTGRRVYFPSGDYPISGPLTYGVQGQRIVGAGVNSSRIFVKNSYASSTAVLTAPVGDSTGIDQISLSFDQGSANSRATLKRFPAALDIRFSSRFKIGHLRIENAWDGINADKGAATTPANPGGMDIGLLEIGAYNNGFALHGAEDFVHATTVHCWPFGITVTAAYYDSNPTCALIGRVDGLDVKSLNSFATKVVFDNRGNSGAARQVSMLQLDGSRATLRVDAGDLQIGQFSSTKGGDGGTEVPSLTVNSGRTIVGNIRMWGGTLGSTVLVNGGNVSVLGGYSQQVRLDAPAFNVAGGTLELSNVFFDMVPTGQLAIPHVFTTGGILIARNNTFLERSSGSGAVIGFNNDNPAHSVTDNNLGRWDMAWGNGLVQGVYGPNDFPASNRYGNVWVGRPRYARVTGTLDANGNRELPHNIPGNYTGGAANRIASIAANLIGPNGEKYPYPFASPSYWDGGNLGLRSNLTGGAGQSFEAYITYY